ncbi:hypothetical protein Tco_0284760 [Tanacetum coccineum]
MQVARDKQKSYADLKRKPMEFQVGDKVMLKVSPWKGFVRFGKRGKLNPRSAMTDEPLAFPFRWNFHFEDNFSHCRERHRNHGNREVKWLRQHRVPSSQVR